MNLFQRTALFCVLAALVFCDVSEAQVNTLVSTTASAAITATTQQIPVVSATNITVSPATMLYVGREAMLVLGVSSTTITVARGQVGTPAIAHVSGVMVLSGRPDWFYTVDPYGACTTASTYVTPYVNILTGGQFLCSTLTLSWVRGWGTSAGPAGVTAAVASAAGAIIPSGPLFHITGTAAITGFTLPLGFSGGRFCAIADAIWTWTAAGNIGTAGTTTAAGRVHCFDWDSNAAKWYPDKVI